MLNPRIRVLLIENNPSDPLWFSRSLDKTCARWMTFVLECVETIQAGLALLSAKAFDLLILDTPLPDGAGLDAVSRVRAQTNIPIVLLSEHSNDDAILTAAAQDVLSKNPLDERALKRALRYALERNRLLQQLENVIDNSPHGMLVVDLSGVVLHMNAAAQTLFMRPATEMVGKPFEYAVEFPARPMEINLGPASATRTAEMRVSKIEWRSRTAYLVCIDGTTEAKKTLPMKAAERQGVEFLTTLAHEIRSELTVVKAAVCNLREGTGGALSEHQTNIVSIANHGVDRLERIVHNILDLKRLESGRAESNAQAVNVSKLIDEELQGFWRILNRQRICLKSNVCSDLPDAYVNLDMTLELLHNLLVNALRYARHTVEVRARLHCPGQIRISVIDDGPGIPEDRIGDLFNKFVQVERLADSDGYKGTGLGLAICQKIVELNHGKIWAESKIGHGTQFHCVLPACACMLPPAPR